MTREISRRVAAFLEEDYFFISRIPEAQCDLVSFTVFGLVRVRERVGLGHFFGTQVYLDPHKLVNLRAPSAIGSGPLMPV
jgi:hypothetical protein